MALSDESGHNYRFGNVRLAGHSQVRVHTGIVRDNRWISPGPPRLRLGQRRRHCHLRNDHPCIVDSESWGRHGH